MYHVLGLHEWILWKWLYYAKQSTDSMQSLLKGSCLAWWWWRGVLWVGHQDVSQSCIHLDLEESLAQPLSCCWPDRSLLHYMGSFHRLHKCPRLTFRLAPSLFLILYMNQIKDHLEPLSCYKDCLNLRTAWRVHHWWKVPVAIDW